MSFLVDSHCHLHDPEFFTPEQQREFLDEAEENHVRQIICIGTSKKDSLIAKNFAASHENVFWTFGIHPEEAQNAPKITSETKKILRNCSLNTPKTAQSSPNERSDVSKRLVAIGEIGLDYHYEGYNRDAQIRLLEQMLDLATKNDLPCSFHVRDAIPDFFAVVANFSDLKPSVLHSYTDTPENLDYALNHNFYIGLNGIATFADLPCFREITPVLLSRIVLETDAPFLTPKPKRGIINRPGNVRYIASWLALKTGVSEAEIAQITTQNVQQIFNLPNPRFSAP